VATTSNDLVGRPHSTQRMVAVLPGVPMLLIGLFLVAVRLNPVGLVLVVLGFAMVSNLWRKVTVHEDHLVAQGRFSRRRLDLREITQVGLSTFAAAWVQPRHGKAIQLWMISEGDDIVNPGRMGFIRQLRERAARAGATLEPELQEPTDPAEADRWFGR